MHAKQAEKHGESTVFVSKRSFVAYKRVWLAGLLAALLLVVLVINIVINNHKKKVPVVVTNVCLKQPNNAILQDAASNFSADKRYQLKTDVVKIKNLPDYQLDPNCMYVLVTYYINIGDVTNAQQTITQLAKVYNPQQRFSAYLGNQPPSLASLQSEVSSMMKTSNQNSKNVFAAGNPQ